MRLEVEGAGWRSGRSGRSRIVEDVTLSVAPGERLGLIGPNGSGKSTLLRMMAGLARPSAGRVLLEGQDLRRLGARGVAQRLAFVQQQAETSDRITVRQAVELGRTPWLSALHPWSPGDDRIVDDALRATGMEGFGARDWMTLSGGERQRVHIGRALAQQPRVLLLDEPTNHLDIRHQLSVLEMVAGLGLTTVIALHDLNQAMGCDRLGVMQGGRLVALGSPAEVLTPALLAGVFGVRGIRLTDPEDGTSLLRFLPVPA